MLLNAYTVFDNKALVYSPPFFQNTDGAAIRMFRDLANDPNTSVGRHPGDYSLFQIGNFSDANASMEAVLPIRHICDAVAVINAKPNDLFADLSGLNGAKAAGSTPADHT